MSQRTGDRFSGAGGASETRLSRSATLTEVTGASIFPSSSEPGSAPSAFRPRRAATTLRKASSVLGALGGGADSAGRPKIPSIAGKSRFAIDSNLLMFCRYIIYMSFV